MTRGPSLVMPGETPYAGEDRDIFFRAEDNALRERLCQQIVNDGMSLAIIGANQACADHYCRMLVKRLRAFPDARLELHSPTSTEELLDRFNEILTSLSTAQAMDRRNPLAPMRLLILGNADQINPASGRLLARLVNSFPGANTQLILLHTDSSQETLLELFGKRLLRWFVPLPSRDDALAMIEAAREGNHENETMRLLQKLDPHLFNPPPLQATLITDDSVDIDPMPEPERRVQDPQDEPEDEPEDNPRSGRSVVSTALISVAMVAISTLVVTLLFPRQTEALHLTLVDKYSTAATMPALPEVPVAPASAPSRGPTIPEVTQDQPRLEAKPQEKIPAPPASSLAPGDSGTLKQLGAERLPPVRAAPVEPPREAIAALKSGSKPQNPATTEEVRPRPAPPAAPVKKAAAAATAQSSNDDPIRAVMQQVHATPAQYIFVQHVALDSYTEAQRWQKATPGLAKSLVVPALSGPANSLKFVVFSGPFDSLTAAKAFSKRVDIPPEPWLRTAASLANALPKGNFSVSNTNDR